MNKLMVLNLIALFSVVNLVSGCVGPAGIFGQMDGGSVMPVFVEQGFNRYLSVEKGEIATNPETGLKYANVWIKNVGDRPLRIIYCYSWYDANGNITNMSGFMQGSQPLDSGVAKPVLLVTTKKESMRYEITIQAQ